MLRDVAPKKGKPGKKASRPKKAPKGGKKAGVARGGTKAEKINRIVEAARRRDARPAHESDFLGRRIP